MVNHLLPSSSTPWEKALSESLDRDAEFSDAIDSIRGFKFARPLVVSNVGPWLLIENGIADLARFFETDEDCLDAGVPWSRLRGTPSAIMTALAWIGYDDASVLDQNVRRKRWNRYQASMGALPPADEVSTLLDAEYLADRSDAVRSVFFRGFFGYDVRAAETAFQKTSRSIIGDSSGIRVGGNTKWSHGRDHAVSGSADNGNRAALGLDVAEPITWNTSSLTWNTPGLTWNGIADIAAVKAWLVLGMPAWLTFKRGDDSVIGYQRATGVDVTSTVNPGTDLAAIKFTGRTPFDVAAGETAAGVSLVLSATVTDPNMTGARWLGPDSLTFPDGVDEADVSISASLAIAFQRTIRENVSFTLTV